MSTRKPRRYDYVHAVELADTYWKTRDAKLKRVLRKLCREAARRADLIQRAYVNPGDREAYIDDIAKRLVP